MNGELVWENLLTYSLQIGLLVVIGGFVPSLLRLRWPGARLIYWQALLAACLLLPLLRPWRQEVIAAMGLPVSPTVATAVPAPPAPRPAIPRSQLGLLVLAAGAAIRFGWLGAGFWRLRRYRRNAERAGRPVPCPAAAKAWLSGEIASPVTFGWRRPVVLLPSRFVELDRPIQDAILCHELLHIERRDWLFMIAEEVVRAIFWFHPAIWWLLAEIQLAREQAVDTLAIDRTDARDEYVDALLAIAGVNARVDLAPAPRFLRRRHLKQRVVSIFKEDSMSRTRWMSQLVAGVSILSATCWLVTGSLRLSAAPQVVNDGAGVSVDVAGASILHRAPVSYPESARRQGVQGTVTVEATLDAAGNVSDARVVSGPDGLRKAALQSVLQWHFAAGSAGALRTVNISFQVPQASAPPATPEPAHAPPLPTVQALPASRINLSLQPVRRVNSVQVVGLSDQVRDDLLSRLPAHEGDLFTSGARLKTMAALRQFDEHLLLNDRVNGEQVALTITVPNYHSEGAPARTTSPELIFRVAPVYPPEAKSADIAGIVKFTAVISTEGTVQNLSVVSGHPLLVPAAIDAVKQWRYKPVLLNGVPVDVKTEISINFALSH